MENLNFEQIEDKIRKIQLSKSLTQEYISNIENNRVKVSLSTLVQMCNALDTTVDYVSF